MTTLPHSLAIEFFTAILTKNSKALKSTFGWTDEQTKNVTSDLQTVAATKLISAGNIITRKQVTKPETNCTPVQSKPQIAKFQTHARLC
ncbi:hypothetical protein [Buttiauxella noackiae]|uniref:hypothetical protein n=1 Tax=Buttiauxella noackiae TaxID=82992 RepID=UPI0028D85048|nr:hypothetical protein [Buttiauxella noackiae]